MDFKNASELLALCGLEGDEDTPVIGMVSRFAGHKGLPAFIKGVRPRPHVYSVP